MSNPTYRYDPTVNPIQASRYKSIPLVEQPDGDFTNVSPATPIPMGFGYEAADDIRKLAAAINTLVEEQQLTNLYLAAILGDNLGEDRCA